MVLALAGTLCITIPQLAPIAVGGIVPLSIVVEIGVVVDAFVVGRRSTRSMLGAPILRYVTGVGILVLSPFVLRVIEYPLVQWMHGAGVGAYVISSAGMSPTLHAGDRLLANGPSVIHRWQLMIYHPRSIPESYSPAG